jgi:hypothetical protein
MVSMDLLPENIYGILLSFLTLWDLPKMDLAILNHRTRYIFLKSLQLREPVQLFVLQKKNQQYYKWMCLRQVPSRNLRIEYSVDRRIYASSAFIAGFSRIKNVSIVKEIKDTILTRILKECKLLEGLDIYTEKLNLLHLMGLPLKTLFLRGKLYSSTVQNICIEKMVLNHSIFSKQDFTVVTQSFCRLAVLKLHFCSGITSDGLKNIANNCVDLIHLEISGDIEDISDGLEYIVRTRKIQKLKLIGHDIFCVGMMSSARDLIELDIFPVAINPEYIGEICRCNPLLSLTIGAYDGRPIELQDEFLGLIIQNCPKELQALSIRFTFSSELFIENISKPNMQIKNLRYLKLNNRTLTNEALNCVAFTFRDLLHLEISGRNITSLPFRNMAHYSLVLESLHIEDGSQMTEEHFTYLFEIVKLKYLEVVDIQMITISTLLNLTKNANNLTILNVIPHDYEHEYLKKLYPLPGGYISKFMEFGRLKMN